MVSAQTRPVALLSPSQRTWVPVGSGPSGWPAEDQPSAVSVDPAVQPNQQILLEQGQAAQSAWLDEVVQRANAILALREGWDGFGARPVDPDCIVAAFAVLSRILPSAPPVPAIIPTNYGGLQLEWHRRGITLEIEVQSPVSVEVSYDDEIKRDSWEGVLQGDYSRVRSALDLIAEREASATA